MVQNQWKKRYNQKWKMYSSVYAKFEKSEISIKVPVNRMIKEIQNHDKLWWTTAKLDHPGDKTCLWVEFNLEQYFSGTRKTWKWVYLYFGGDVLLIFNGFW